MAYDEPTGFRTIMQSYVDCYPSSTKTMKSCEVIKSHNLLPQKLVEVEVSKT